MDAYLARIRKTIADGRNLVSQVELRIAETDRMLERQGLTREQVMAMRFSEAQVDAVNAELKRRGLDPLERWNSSDDGDTLQSGEDDARALLGIGPQEGSGDEVSYRQRKFGMMMKPFQL